MQPDQPNARPEIRVLWTAVVVCFFVCPCLQAQPDTNTPARMKPTVVTGSYIPTAETVGPAPVETLGASEIQRVGADDVLHVLKKLSPSFSGNANIGQEVNNGGAGETYVALRNLKTLVLINGRRLGSTVFSYPTLYGATSGFADLNTIPLAAIERIEVLKDGASALYGSEAVGGVINIITKKDFSGVELGGRYGFATGQGDFAESRAWVVGGAATPGGEASFTAAAQYYHSDALASSDRKAASMSADNMTAHNLDPGSVFYQSPSFPGKVQDSTGPYILRSSPLLQPFGLYDPTAAPSPPRIPNGSGGYKTFSGPTAVSDYNSDPFWQTSSGQALGGAPYVADPGVLLNTTTLGTDSIQSQERWNAFANGSVDLIGKQMRAFGDFLYAHIESEGKLAPSPVVGLGPKQANINIPADNPFNPFNIDLGPNSPTGLPPAGPRIRSRFWDSGNRLFDANTDFYHVVGGLTGDLDNGWSYNAGLTYNLYDQIQYVHNAINGVNLDLALKPNTNPVLAAQGLSQLLDRSGTAVPVYNLFSIPGQNDAATLNAIRATLFSAGTSREWDGQAVINGAPLDLPGGKLGVAFGGGYTEERLDTDFDKLTQLGKVPGLNPALPTSGRRSSWAGFGEIRVPITSPDMNLPVLRSLELTAAGRYETFDPGGDAAVPKVTLRWQPIDEQATLRMSYSQSFVAPATFELFGGDAVNVPLIGLPVNSGTNAAVRGLQEYVVNRSNPDLKPRDAENWSGGIVISPKIISGLTLSVDYYHVRTRNDIFRVPAQVMVDDLNARSSASIWQPYFFKADASQITTTAVNQANDADWGTLIDPLRNGAAIETDGLDLTGSYQLDAEAAGKFTFYANANLLLSYDYSDPYSGHFHYGGKFSDASTGDPGGQGTLPDYQINTGLVWDFRDFTYSVNARYLPPVPTASGSNFTVNGKGWTVDSWYSVDMQLAYQFGEKFGTWLKGTRLAVGVNNVTDNDPPLVASVFEDNTDKSTYDIIGRFIYFELSKKF